MLPNSYETVLDKIKQDWFLAGWNAAEKEVKNTKWLINRMRVSLDELNEFFDPVYKEPKN